MYVHFRGVHLYVYGDNNTKEHPRSEVASERSQRIFMNQQLANAATLNDLGDCLMEMKTITTFLQLFFISTTTISRHWIWTNIALLARYAIH